MKAQLTPTLAYRNPKAAMEWLQAAFACEVAMLLTDKDGEIAHLVMSIGGAEFGVMREWESPALLGPARMRSPASLDGVGTQFLRLVVENIGAHCERARAAGARIVQEPELQPYGDRTYRALDIEGHVWNFGEPEQALTHAEVEAAMGLKIVKG